jgi:hypothetical protein
MRCGNKATVGNCRQKTRDLKTEGETSGDVSLYTLVGPPDYIAINILAICSLLSSFSKLFQKQKGRSVLDERIKQEVVGIAPGFTAVKN